MGVALAVVLAAFGSVFLLAMILAFIAFVCKFTKNRDYGRRLRHHQIRTVLNPELSVKTDESASFDPTINRISMEELKVSTKNFSTDLIIGDGSFGLVYKAALYNGSTVAIKKLDPDAFQGFREFRAEMETLGVLRHGNIVKILGYCVSGMDRVLILEFVERGSLDQWIHDTSSSNNEYLEDKFPLSWETRIKIMMEKKEMGLIEWVKKMLAQNRHMEILDRNMHKEGLSGDEVNEYFRIASLCTEEIMVDRPAMSEVVDLLNKLST
ncbi:hypothetical protein OIU74_019873 [Salix koriyanagi]|uniref:Protein kinase domain-containing protein n=1 Tax=Salix koriyanagi TaxID=2511006 RepID=A0A9Q0P4F4_9ROSI|nr:hypothetical protein OIU74_019873 [Salix koriyanagi]